MKMVKGGVQERGKSTLTGIAAIVLSDTDDEAEAPRRTVASGKMKAIAKDHVPVRHDRAVLDKALSKLLGIFPDACPEAVAAQLAAQLNKTSPSTALQRIVDRFLKDGVPKPLKGSQDESNPGPSRVTEEVVYLRTSVQAVGSSGQVEQKMNTSAEVVPADKLEEYMEWSMLTLIKEFPRYPLNDLKRVLAENNNRFAPSHKAISAQYATAIALERNEDEGGGKATLNSTCDLGNPYNLSHKKPCVFFEREYLSLRNALRKGLEQDTSELKKDTDLEEKTDRIDYDGEASGNVECGCCYSDYRFEEMAQCAEGHLFCFNCLRRRVEESTFGGAQACSSLPCMDTGGCEESFPWSEVKRALPPDVLSKYEQRQAEDAVVQAKLLGLVYCPFCNTPWEVDPDLRVLECGNESCQKASCLLCKEPSHIPLRCEEVEKTSETSLRRSIEERMTKALIRVCTACKAELVKSDGCNKVTCRCGQAMCYVCRQPIAANYQHFCQHARAAKKDCTVCKKCNLWQEEEEDEIVKAARETAMKELARDDPNLLKRSIGPKLEKQPKKRQKYPIVPAVPFRAPPPEYYNRMVQAMVGVGENHV